MRTSVSISAVLAASLVLVAACTGHVSVDELTPEMRAAAADVRFYDHRGAPPRMFTSLGQVDGLSCRMNYYQPRPSRLQALDQLRIKAAQLGANGIIQVFCTERNTIHISIPCVQSITCAGTAVKVAEHAEDAPKAGGSGSGFFINPAGDVVTNAHVTEGCSEVTVEAENGRGVADVLFQDRHTDLALVRTRRPAPAFLRLRTAPSLQLAETVLTAGYPLGGLLSSRVHVTDGSISALAGAHDDTRMIQFTAPIQSGNSGGPLVDLAGNLVGVNTSGMNVRLAQNVNFAVKTAVLANFLDSLRVDYRTAASRGTMSKTDVAAHATRATVKLTCVPSAAPAS